MAQISKMNINGTPYDLAGGAGGTSYIAGDGITIDANGRISVLFPEYLTSEQLADLRDELLQNQAMITGDLNVLTGEVENGAMIMTYMNSEIAGIRASVWSSEGMWNTIDMLPDSIKTTIVRDWTSEGGLLTKFEHEMLLTNSESYDKIMRYINDPSEGSFVRSNEFNRTMGETRSYIDEIKDSELTRYNHLVQSISETSSRISDIANDFDSTVTQTAENLTIEFNKKIGASAETLENINTRFTFDTDGLTISGGNVSNRTSTRLDGEGMHILSANGTEIATATSSIFKSNNALGIKNWIIATSGSNEGILNIYRDLV